MRRILLCQPRGFCAGVQRAVDAVDTLLDVATEPVYVRKEVVHNRVVVEGFTSRGVKFIDEVEDAPPGSLMVFSAHGVSPQVRRRARDLGHRFVDATCPLVTKVHREVRRFAELGYSVLLVGHAGHEEVDGILGHGGTNVHLIQTVADARAIRVTDVDNVAVVTQTTLSLSEAREIVAILKDRFPLVQEPARRDICYATENRQDAVRILAQQSEAIIIIGSQNSSNSQSLRNVARAYGIPAYLVDNPAAVQRQWLTCIGTVGISAGASSPESLVQAIVVSIQHLEPEFTSVETIGDREPAMIFRPPERPMVAK
ncbi:MAG: 4-hydroxy-3-methylbut-2-enyl diphosphate reductase [Vulcanimicrobiaceae bacterium]